MHEPTNAFELNNYYRDRLLQISITMYSIEKQKNEVFLGTGFLVHPDGYALSARHVFAPLKDKQNFEPVKDGVQIRNANGADFISLDLVPNTLMLSETSDTALFRVETKTKQPINRYMCVELDEAKVATAGSVTAVSWLNLSGAGGWTPNVANDSIAQANGPGDNFEYWGLSKQFVGSMSGGAILQNDRVVGVISNSLYFNGKTIEGGNYANLIRFATDLGLQQARAAKCGSIVPHERAMQRFADQKQYMSSTCEGTLAWVSARFGTVHWSLPLDGNYRLRRKDLACDPSVCRCTGESAVKTIRFVVNHSVAQTSSVTCDSDASLQNNAGEAMFYGAQVVPIFDSGQVENVDEETWLYRNPAFYRRNSNGAFFTPRTDSRLSLGVRRKPSAFNAALAASENASGQCVKALSRLECDDIYAITRFDEAFKLSWPWHGYPRKTHAPRSTLNVEDLGQIWTVQSSWIKDQDLQVKNWILRYRVTNQSVTNNPVTFAFCVDERWKGFFLRSFSPERAIRGKPAHIFIAD